MGVSRCGDFRAKLVVGNFRVPKPRLIMLVAEGLADGEELRSNLLRSSAKSSEPK